MGGCFEMVKNFVDSLRRCDPAPFCLFDEIDAALDPNYRANVATLIAEEAKKGRQVRQIPLSFPLERVHQFV